MKNRIGIVILVLACVVLAIAYVFVKHDAAKDHAEAADRIQSFSNKWVDTSAKLEIAYDSYELGVDDEPSHTPTSYVPVG